MNKIQITTLASMAIFTAILFTGTIDFSNINSNAFAIQVSHHPSPIHTCSTHHPPFNCCPKNAINCHCKGHGIDTVTCTFRLHHK